MCFRIRVGSDGGVRRDSFGLTVLGKDVVDVLGEQGVDRGDRGRGWGGAGCRCRMATGTLVLGPIQQLVLMLRQ